MCQQKKILDHTPHPVEQTVLALSGLIGQRNFDPQPCMWEHMCGTSRRPNVVIHFLSFLPLSLSFEMTAAAADKYSLKYSMQGRFVALRAALLRLYLRARTVIRPHIAWQQKMISTGICACRLVPGRSRKMRSLSH